jgi:pimeloyl-ACP methyl ester carboxylesterase
MLAATLFSVTYTVENVMDDAVRLNATAHGPFNVASENVIVGGYVCGGNQGAVVYYPTDHDKSPLISFAHGFTAGGESVAVDYAPLLKGVASWGYVIVALKAAPLNYCIRETEDQIRNLVWAKTSKFADRIDWDKKTGIMGHSMGGQATHLTANNQAAVSTHNIGAAVALHPVYVAGGSKIPIFYGTGTLDTIVPPGTVRTAYTQTLGVSKVFANILGATHLEPNTVGPNRWTDYAAAMFGCYLYEMDDACTTVFGNSPLKSSHQLCSGEIPMSECLTKGP